MNVGFQQVVNGRIHQPVSCNRRDASECFGDDAYPKVAMPLGGTGVPRVLMALILDDEVDRGEMRHQPLAQPLLAGCGIQVWSSAAAGLVFPVSQMTCGIMKISIATVIPKTLKLTQVDSVKFPAI